MNRTIRLLAMVLGIQLLLALGLHFTGPDLATPTLQTPVLSFDRERVDQLLVEGPNDAQVRLTRRDGSWTLPELGDFPADATRVAQLVARLAELQAGPPVATSAAAQPRFRVDDTDFERRVTLFSGDDRLTAIYLGSSPGMGQIHVRADGSDAIHVVELAAFDIPVQTDEWIDRLLVRVPLQDIAAIAIDDLRLERSQAAPEPSEIEAATLEPKPRQPWNASGLRAGEQLDQQAADALASQLAELSISAVLGDAVKPEYGLESPALTLAVTRTSGEIQTFALGKSADGQQYTLKVSHRPEYLRLPSYTAEQLLAAAARDALVSVEEEPGSAEQPGAVEEP